MVTTPNPRGKALLPTNEKNHECKSPSGRCFTAGKKFVATFKVALKNYLHEGFFYKLLLGHFEGYFLGSHFRNHFESFLSSFF